MKNTFDIEQFEHLSTWNKFVTVSIEMWFALTLYKIYIWHDGHYMATKIM